MQSSGKRISEFDGLGKAWIGNRNFEKRHWSGDEKFKFHLVTLKLLFHMCIGLFHVSSLIQRRFSIKTCKISNEVTHMFIHKLRSPIITSKKSKKAKETNTLD